MATSHNVHEPTGHLPNDSGFAPQDDKYIEKTTHDPEKHGGGIEVRDLSGTHGPTGDIVVNRDLHRGLKSRHIQVRFDA
jgi:hypothetical protein